MPILRSKLCLVLKNDDSDKEEDTVDLTASTLTGIKQKIAGQRQQEGNRFSRAKSKMLIVPTPVTKVIANSSR